MFLFSLSFSIPLLLTPSSFIAYLIYSLNMQLVTLPRASQVAQVLKNLPANAGDCGSIPGSERSPGGGCGNPFQHSCLQNPMGKGAWRTTVCGVTRSWARLCTHACMTYHACMHGHANTADHHSQGACPLLKPSLSLFFVLSWVGASLTSLSSSLFLYRPLPPSCGRPGA